MSTVDPDGTIITIEARPRGAPLARALAWPLGGEDLGSSR